MKNHTANLYRYLLYSALASIPFLLLSYLILIDSQWLISFDTIVGQFFYNSGSESFTRKVVIFTSIGNVKSVVIIVIILSLLISLRYKHWKKALWFALTVLLGAGIVNNFVKNTFERTRPLLTHLVEEHSYSFPSGHAMGAIIYSGALAFLIYKANKSKIAHLKFYTVSGTLLFSLLIAMSRLYLGVHFASDVIAGLSLGAAFLFIAMAIYERWLDTDLS